MQNEPEPSRKELDVASLVKTKPVYLIWLWLLGGTLGFALGIVATLLWAANNTTPTTPVATSKFTQELKAVATNTVTAVPDPTFTLTNDINNNNIASGNSASESKPAGVSVATIISTSTPNLAPTKATTTLLVPTDIATTKPALTAATTERVPLPPAVKAKAPVVTGKLGATLKYQDYALTVTQLEKSDRVEEAGGISDQAAPDAQFVFVNLTYTNGAAEMNLESNIFFHSPTIRDNNNFIYTLDAFRSKTPALNDMAGNTLRPGDKTKGWLTYQLPKTAKGLVFEFQLRGDNPFTPAFGVFQVALDTTASFSLPPDSTPSGVGPSGKLGQTTNAGAYFMTVNKAETTQTIAGYSAEAGNQFVTVEVTFQSNADQNVDINANDLSLKDSEGFRYSNTFRRQPELQTVSDLPAGTKLHGWVTFEVPTTASGFVLQFLPGNSKVVTLAVAL